ncbi:MAG: hypothetical protein HC927_00510 [Deltaproteobacteria bacterium]|nr:hypothetical protein [Deltaproteobacteria bacterium]
MQRKRLSLTCVPFDPLAFERVVADASGCPLSAIDDQVKYIAAYLGSTEIGARTLLIETPYFDRHYMEEFSAYYATAFRPPDSHTTRIHVFACPLSDLDLGSALIAKIRGSETMLDAVHRDYRGFIVIRPLASAPIGRTILSTYTSSPSRVFATAREHKAHVMGLEFGVHGVPFQQQEVAVGACATTAVWSALASIARASGSRGPSPYEVTQAATRHLINDRQIPADGGLEIAQVLEAMRAAGYSPLALKASSRTYAQFTLALKCYLTSGMPVVLFVHDANGYHAVTVVGYRRSDEQIPAPDITLETAEGGVRLVSDGMSRVYIHEDRLGPYARMSWQPAGHGGDGPEIAHLKLGNAAYQYDPKPMAVHAAVVPLYPKLRLSALGLIHIATEAEIFIRFIVGPDASHDLRFDLSFELCGDYTKRLLAIGLPDPVPLHDFLTQVPLPRYVGVIRFFLGRSALVDVICDTTDIDRSKPRFGNILAVVPFSADRIVHFRRFATQYLQ